MGSLTTVLPATILIILNTFIVESFSRQRYDGWYNNLANPGWGTAGGGYSRQRYDGWYNNLANPSWGSSGEEILYRVPPAYSDMTYQPSGTDRPNPRFISNQVFSGPSGIPSYRNKTTMFVFFGQLIAYELVHASDSNCPVELLKVDIPEGDPDFGNSSGPNMPFIRSGYNKKSGQSPNNPRKPINAVTAWIDGNFIYGHSEVWANCLRSFTGGQLLTLNSTKDFPAINKIGLPLDNFPSPTKHKLADPTKLWMFGDKHTHQSPGLAALALVWFRYHNHVARSIQKKHPDWRDEKIFRKARRKVVAILQNIIFYEWLPQLLHESVPEYTGYKSHIQPGISALFEAAAFRFGHTMVPPGLYLRDATCRYRRFGDKKGLRMCNIYWRSQELLETYSLEEILMGMTSQVAEREDNILVSDLRGKAFGPLHYSRHDLAVMTLMRGRDHGLPDYNTVREALGLPRIEQWQEINPWLYSRRKEDGLNDTKVNETMEVYRLMKTYRHLDDIDVFPAGLMEFTPSGPGPLFRHVIKDQFLRIRDADRYWFENKLHGLFSDDEMKEIRSTKLIDVLKAVTKIRDIDVQSNIFVWNNGDPCQQPKQLVEEDLEECTPHQGYDYFTGSEIPYITAFTSIGIFPFVCILGAYIIYKIKMAVYNYRSKSTRKEAVVIGMTGVSGEGSISGRRNSLATSDISSTRSNNSGSHPPRAWEWSGKTEPQRHVELELDEEQAALTLLSDKGKTLRTVDFMRMERVTFYTNNDTRRNLLMLHIPKEYDLVLRFRTEQSRNRFHSALQCVLETAQKDVTRHECRERYIFDRAITKTKRKELLSKFFRGVFAEAYNIREIGPMDDIGEQQCRDIQECELSREEFAEALALAPDSVFVNQMFSVIDREQKGYISFRDMIYALVVFSKGSGEDKLYLLFSMYDTDKNGTLDRGEIAKMLRSMLEMAGTAPSREEMAKLIDRIYSIAGLQAANEMRFEDFKKAFSEHSELLQKVSLDLKGASSFSVKSSKRWSVSDRGASDRRPLSPENSTSSSKSEVNSSLRRRSRKSVTDGPILKSMTLDVKPEVYSRLGAVIKDLRHYMENHRQHLVYSFIFFFACGLVFTERFYTYAVDLEHKGFRSITGYGVSLTRGASAAISLCYSVLLLTMCRNVITFLRETVLNLYVPFDSAVSFHKMVAWTGLFFVVTHVIGYCFNFYHIATQPVQFLCVFDEVYLRSDMLPTFSFWFFMTLTGSTGYLTVLVLCIVYIFATQTARAYIFNAFWITHKLFYVFYILVLLHGASRLLQNPMFWNYFIGPAILFTIDKTISLSRKKREILIEQVELLPSNVTKVEFRRPANFEYKSGQWIRLACVELGKNEYHPFTLTSAPHEDTLCVHIRSAGPWTSAFRQLVSREERKSKPLPTLYLDGPYGAGQQDWYRYDVSVLVGGGIGVTPYASILKNLLFMSSVKNTFRIKNRKVYFIWVTGSQRQYEWFIDILHQMEAADDAGLVEAHIFITQFFQKFDLRTTMLYICEEHFQRVANKSIFTGLQAKTHFGRPNFDEILVEVSRKHPKVRKMGVFSCGPPGLTKGVEKACTNAGPYAVDLEHKGFRSIAGYGVSLTRGAAASISLCFSLLLLTMCRNLITVLRETVINLYIPFDSAISFHKMVAWVALFFSGIHVLGYCFNFYHIATQPVQFLCVFNEIHFRSDMLPTFSFWLFMNLTGITGYLLVLVICIMYTFATQTSRSHIFNAFWITHKLFYVLYILILLHGASRVIQSPMFWYYFIGPAIIFTLDKTISLSRKKKEIQIQDAELLPSEVARVVFKRPQNFEYKSGQWIRVACVELGKNEYHPFTLTSAPHEDTLCMHIRTAGPWTSAFRNLLRADNLKNQPMPTLYLDGPYGAGQQDWYRYDVSVLVGGGIGVTPYASILKDFVFMASVKNTFRMKCRKVYFVWVTASQRQYEWFIDILRQVEAVDQSELVENHIFITQFFQKFDLRTTMLYICEEHFQRLASKSIFTGLKAHTHFGRPNFEDILVEVHRKHPKVRKVGVFSCGPPGLTKGVEKACHSSSGKTKASFLHHFENF